MGRYAWEPTPEYVEHANVTRLMRRHGVASIDELRARSIADIRWYWNAVVEDLDIPFATPYTEILDDSRGIQWPRWFVDGRVNITTVCVDRWLDDPHTAARTALIAESEDGGLRTLTFAELAVEIDRLASALRADGLGRGDTIGVFMPMVAEAVVAAYAVAKIGAVYLPIFSGFAPNAIAARLQDAEAAAVITADGTQRRGHEVVMKPTLDEALRTCPSVRRVVVHPRLGRDVALQEGRDVAWPAFVAGHDGPVTAADTDAEDIFLLGYTSGTSGRPKGALLPHGGFLVKIASECAYQTDIHAGEVWYWVTDMGWIMGPLSMVGAHANGAAMVVYDGAPDFPQPDRIWATVARTGATMLGVSPTLIRALKTHGDDLPGRNDLSSLRILGSTGEPWNPEPYEWLMRVTGGGVPIINLSGGTEVGACFLSPFPVEPIKSCSLGGISLGMDMDVFDADGGSLREHVGELVAKQPWPSMTRGVLNDRQRYLDAYWSMYPDVWRHGDWAKIDGDGQWFLYGRSDEAINVAGKRLGPAEVESILVEHPAVAESACVGVPDARKGEAIWCFWVAAAPAQSAEVHARVSEELSGLIVAGLGRPFKPSRVVRVDALPKTRSAKILRRAVRAVATGADPGDLSVAENPWAVEAIRAALSGSARTT